MGQQYVALLKEAKEKGGLTLATRIAVILGAGGEAAAAAPDEPDKITKAREAINNA